MPSLMDLESTLALSLPHVELLGELDLNLALTQELGQAIAGLVARQGRTDALRLLEERYPVCLAAYLVAKGIYGYHGGDYWTSVAEECGLNKSNLSTQLGGFFEHFLQTRNLPRFPGIHGHRFLILLLTHGGIPDYSLPDFFANMLMPALTTGQLDTLDAHEVISYWLYESSGRYATDTPVKRFLEHGGSFAIDFVNRCIEMATGYVQQETIAAAHALGLPERVVNKFREWVSAHATGEVISAPRIRLQRPRCVFDPWSGTLAFELPEQALALSGVASQGEWRLRHDQGTDCFPFRPYRSSAGWISDFQHGVLEALSATWSIDYALGSLQRTWRFQGFTPATPWLIFDPESGELLRHTGTLPARPVWLLTPKQAGLAVEGGVLLERFPTVLLGDTLYVAESWDLTTARSVRIGHVQVAVEPDASLGRPTLSGRLLTGLYHTDQYPSVYLGRAPAVCIPVPPQRDAHTEAARWHVGLRDLHGGPVLATPLTALSYTVDEDGLQLALSDPACLGERAFGTFEVSLRGPLGRDARMIFAVVPSLTIRGLGGVRIPDAHGNYREPVVVLKTPPDIVVESTDALVSLQPAKSGGYTLVAQPTCTMALISLRATAPSVAQRVSCAIPLPLLRWAIVDHHESLRSSPVWQSRPVEQPVAWLEHCAAPQLIVEIAAAAGLASTLRGTLQIATQPNAAAQILRPRGRTSRWLQFNLGEALDTVRRSRSGRTRVDLQLDDVSEDDAPEPLVLALFTQALGVEGLAVQSSVRGDVWQLAVRWRGGRRLTQRVLRFWSLSRPWDPPFAWPVPDTDTQGTSITAPLATLPPGNYRLELATHDPWSSVAPIRPALASPDTADCSVGDSQMQQAYLKDLPLTPLARLEACLAVADEARQQRMLDDLTRATTLPGYEPLFQAAVIMMERTHLLSERQRAPLVAAFRTLLLRAPMDTLVMAVRLGVQAPPWHRPSIETTLWMIDADLGMLLHRVLEDRSITTHAIAGYAGVGVDEQATLTSLFLDSGIVVVDQDTAEVHTPETDAGRSFYDELPPWLLSDDALDSVKMYLHEIGQYPLLNPEHERRLAQSISDGLAAAAELSQLPPAASPFQAAMLRDRVQQGAAAREQMIHANLRLVISVAKRYMRGSMAFLDLIQEGNIGLLRAIEKFDPQRGYKFSTYAMWWIRQAITRAKADQGRTIRLPVHMIELLNRFHRTINHLTKDLGREPTDHEIAESLDIAVSRVQHLRTYAQDTVSLSTPIGEGDGSTLGDMLEAPEDAPIETLIEQGDLRTRIIKLFYEMQLSERERMVLERRYGFHGGRVETLEEIGQSLGVTRERIRQIEVKALRKLKNSRMARTALDGYADWSRLTPDARR